MVYTLDLSIFKIRYPFLFGLVETGFQGLRLYDLGCFVFYSSNKKHSEEFEKDFCISSGIKLMMQWSGVENKMSIHLQVKVEQKGLTNVRDNQDSYRIPRNFNLSSVVLLII